MSQINRLSSGGRIDRNRPLTFSFNGQHYQGYAGDTLAAALLALVGVVAEYTRIVPEWVMLILFLVAFFLYGYCIKRAWKVARLVKRIRRRIRRHSGNNPKLTK